MTWRIHTVNRSSADPPETHVSRCIMGYESSTCCSSDPPAPADRRRTGRRASGARTAGGRSLAEEGWSHWTTGRWQTTRAVPADWPGATAGRSQEGAGPLWPSSAPPPPQVCVCCCDPMCWRTASWVKYTDLCLLIIVRSWRYKHAYHVWSKTISSCPVN